MKFVFVTVLLAFGALSARADYMNLYCGKGREKYEVAKAEVALVSAEGPAKVYFKGKQAKNYRVTENNGVVSAQETLSGADQIARLLEFKGECDGENSVKMQAYKVGGFAGIKEKDGAALSCHCEQL